MERTMDAPNITRRRLLKGVLGAVAGTALSAGGGYLYAHDIEPHWIEVTHVELTLPRLASAFAGYRIVHLSDIHIDTSVTVTRLPDIVTLVNRQDPDLITITGDFATRQPRRYADALVRPLGRLRARDGVVAVLGNHDHWSDPDAVREILHTAGIRELRNSLHTVDHDDHRLHVAGVDDYWNRKADLEAVVQRVPALASAILLVHEPDFADVSAATGRFDLQLSGHSHGGQVVLPVLGAPILPRYARKYPRGLYRVGDMFVYTTRGLGTLPPPVRFNCRPEVTVIDLQSPAST